MYSCYLRPPRKHILSTLKLSEYQYTKEMKKVESQLILSMLVFLIILNLLHNIIIY